VLNNNNITKKSQKSLFLKTSLGLLKIISSPLFILYGNSPNVLVIAYDGKN